MVTVRGLTTIDNTAESGVTYIYTVRAYGDGVWSSYDDTGMSFTRLGQPNVSSVSNVAGGIAVEWATVGGADHYRIYRKTEGGNWATLTTLGGTATSFTDATAVGGTVYYYTVRAYASAIGWSTYDSVGVSCTAQ